MALVTYEQAVRHLHQEGVLDVSPDDPDLALKVKQASSIVRVFTKREAEWDENTDPEEDGDFAIAQAMTLRVLGWLYRFRGDDEKDTSLEDILKSSGITGLREPTIA